MPSNHAIIVSRTDRQGNGTNCTFLRVVDICKHYDGVTALDGVSFEVGTGEILALAGENGSGKSTLIRIIAGVERANKGMLFIEGADLTGRSPIERIEAGIEVIYQDFALFPNLSAGENIWLPQQLHQRRRLIARSMGVAMAQRVLNEVGVTIELDRPVAELPVAQKQLVAIARALVHDARLLIMDEPTTALTHRKVQHLFEIIRSLAARGRASFSSATSFRRSPRFVIGSWFFEWIEDA